MRVAFIESLRMRGWKFVPFRGTAPTPIPSRYRSLPDELVQFLNSYELFCNGDETQWFIAAADYSTDSTSAFAWNEFEQMSLAAAEGQRAWCEDVRAFWDAHLPILMSVRGHYSYVAYCCSGSNAGRYVTGSEPEFEEVSVVGSSLEEFGTWVLDSNAEG